VDVTTELSSESQITRSSSSDEYYGTRVLISPISGFFGAYGGIAYVGAFDDVGDYYKPALVFPENLGPNGAKYIAEAASHEAGHNLGLSHDGTASQGYYAGQGSGTTGWAPIMGVGYYQNVSQWSKGEYSGANNTQDDLAIIQTYGLPYRTDDHGNTAAGASMFPAGTQLSGTGVIEQSSDVDVFGFTTGAGLVSISINPSDLGPNLDILAELRDSNGSLITSSNPSGGLNASFVLTLGAGTYYLHIRGTGSGDPATTGYSSYASLGQYWISGTVVSPGLIPPVASLVLSPASGPAPLSVTLNASGSFDQDGTIVRYDWYFGDGGWASGSSATISHIYTTPMSGWVILDVTDNNGLTTRASAWLDVLTAATQNAPPIASATATPSSGDAPLAVTFDGSASTDSDGSIVSYQWNFGDGTTGSGAAVQHTYQNTGTYAVTLTVTDDDGATASTTLQITATQKPAGTIRVQSIALAVLNSNAGKSVRATVRVTDLSSVAVSGVTVTGNFTGLVSGTVSGVTDQYGNAVLTSRKSKKGGSTTFTVSSLAKSGWNYNPGYNLQNSVTTSFEPEIAWIDEEEVDSDSSVE
jgi:PKD repeat protein